VLSRIARGLYEIGRALERAQNTIRILEVNHKMHLERESVADGNIWEAVADAFGLEVVGPDEAALYEALVFSEKHRHAVLASIRLAREHGRAARDHISEEMWLFLNESYLALRPLGFADVQRTGRSDFNRRIEISCDGFHGLADSTMNHGSAWHFLRAGRFVERAGMVCRVLDIKRKSLVNAAEVGRPVDVHQWQTLLRSLSGYECYRREHDARIEPGRVLSFVLQNPEFPRSLRFALDSLAASLRRVASSNPAQTEVQLLVHELGREIRDLDCGDLLANGELELVNPKLRRQVDALDRVLGVAFFGSLRPTPAPVVVAAGATQVAQQ